MTSIKAAALVLFSVAGLAAQGLGISNGSTGGGGTIPATTDALKGDGAGNAAAVTGSPGDCVHVDGGSGACSGGGGTGSQRGAFGSRPTCDGSTSGQSYYATDTPGLISQCNGTSWLDTVGGFAVTVPPASGSFTTVNGGTLSQSGAGLLYQKNTSGLGVNLVALANPSGSWDVQLAMRLLTFFPNAECGLWLTTGTTAGTDSAFGLAVSITGNGAQFFQRNYVPINGSIGDTGALAFPYATGGSPGFLRLTRSGTTITSYWGDGTTWQALGTFTALAITHYGFGCDPRSTTNAPVKVYSLLEQ